MCKRRSSVIAAAAFAAGVALVFATAGCGGSGNGGLSVVGSPSSASPSATSGATVPATSSPSVPASPSALQSAGASTSELTADELRAYAALAAPIYNKVTRYGGEVSFIISQTSETRGAEWNSSAFSIEEYAQKIEVQRAKWDMITPPPALADAHAALADAFATEQQAYELLAGNLRGGSAQPPGWGNDVQALLDQASEGYHTFSSAIAGQVGRLHVDLPFQFPD